MGGGGGGSVINIMKFLCFISSTVINIQHQAYNDESMLKDVCII